MDSENYFELGCQNCREYYSSRSFASFTRSIRAEDAIKLFWPPTEEQLVMMSMPLPKPRQEWVAGFKAEQIKMLAEPNQKT